MSSHRHILRATAIIGGASAMNILIGLVRNKVAALLLGPAGIGVIGLLLNLVTTIASLAGLGIAMSSVRALASASDEHDRALLRRIIARITLALAIVGGAGIWLLRDPIARYVLGDVGLAWQIGWLAPAVALTLWSSVQIALLNGSRRLGDLARAQVGGAALGSLLGVIALLIWRAGGIVSYVLAAPLGMVMAGHVYTRRLPRAIGAASPDRLAMRTASGDPVRLGIPMMLGGLALPLGLLLIRAMLGDRLGAAALGQFTAAWTLSATYVGFVLAAMGTDYFPRLSAAVDDHATARQMVIDQTEVALLLAMPVLLGVQATAPWLIQLLYSSAFTPAVAILQWQIAGDVLKLASWPLAFVLLAQGRGKLYWIIETSVIALLVAVAWLLVMPLGLAATGIAYFLSYAVYLPILLVAAHRLIGLRLHPRIVVLTAMGLAGVGVIAWLGSYSSLAGLAVGLLIATASAGYTLLFLQRQGTVRTTEPVGKPS